MNVSFIIQYNFGKNMKKIQMLALLTITLDFTRNSKTQVGTVASSTE